jgi:hypothetical protein
MNEETPIVAPDKFIEYHKSQQHVKSLFLNFVHHVYYKIIK